MHSSDDSIPSNTGSVESDRDGPGTVEEWGAYVAPRLGAVRERLNLAGGEHVELLAVSKGQPIEAVHAAVALGITDLGENYAQELATKAAAVRDAGQAMQWHFIGQLQSNKVRLVAPWVALWQSVDRLRIAKEIVKRTIDPTDSSASPDPTLLVQVNLSRHEHKGGCNFDDLDELVDGIRELDVDVRGLMGVGEADDPATTSAQFTRLRTACDRLGLSVCSMGMSADLEAAVQCGSTMVRVGSDIFGPRRAPRN